MDEMKQYVQRNALWIAATIVVGYLIFHFTFHPFEEEKIQGYETIYSAKLNGRIKNLFVSSSFFFIEIFGDSATYQFQPLPALDPNGTYFGSVASKNDSIYKSANSDTIYLNTSHGNFAFKIINQIPLSKRGHKNIKDTTDTQKD